jgi:hypothetical protein
MACVVVLLDMAATSSDVNQKVNGLANVTNEDANIKAANELK